MYYVSNCIYDVIYVHMYAYKCYNEGDKCKKNVIFALLWYR